MITVSIINQKGGVGKTTTAVNLGSFLSKNHKVLIIDADKQGNLSSNFNVETSEASNVYDLFTKRDTEPVVINENLHVIPADGDMAGIDFRIQNELSREMILKKSLDKFKGSYDYCIIDCPPDINLVTINALSCSDGLIIPLNLDFFGSKGITAMVKFIKDLRGAINPQLSIYGILITSYDKRLTVSKQGLLDFEEQGAIDALFKSKIRTNTAIPLSQENRKSIFDYDPKSNGAKDYGEFGEEFLLKMKELYN